MFNGCINSLKCESIRNWMEWYGFGVQTKTIPMRREIRKQKNKNIYCLNYVIYRSPFSHSNACEMWTTSTCKNSMIYRANGKLCHIKNVNFVILNVLATKWLFRWSLDLKMNYYTEKMCFVNEKRKKNPSRMIKESEKEALKLPENVKRLWISQSSYLVCSSNILTFNEFFPCN